MRPRLILLVVLALLLGGCTSDDRRRESDPDDPAPPQWTWSDGGEPAIPRGEAACASDGTRLVLVGGFTEPTGPNVMAVTAAVEVYDLAAGTWSRAPDLPTAVHHTAVAHHDGRFYVVGGDVTTQFVATEAVWSWAPGGPRWQAEPPLPAARGAHGVAVVDGKIHAVGGVGRDGLLADVHAFDPATDTWSTATQVPLVREHLAVGGHDGTLYVAAGRAGAFDSTIDRFDIYPTTNGTWSEGPPLPTPRGGAAGSAGPHGFAVVGGEGDGGTFEEVELYDPKTRTWASLPPDPQPRHGLCVAWMDDGLHVVAGGHEPGFTWSTTHTVARLVQV